jgi:hypothetical protein
MKQKIAIGASWMTRPMSFIATSNTPSIASLSCSVRRVCTSSRPTPKNSAKNMTARMSFSLIAAKRLLGTMPITASTPVLASAEVLMMLAAPSPPWASSSRAATGSTPSPGRRMFTAASEMATAMLDTITV